MLTQYPHSVPVKVAWHPSELVTLPDFVHCHSIEWLLDGTFIPPSTEPMLYSQDVTRGACWKARNILASRECLRLFSLINLHCSSWATAEGSVYPWPPLLLLSLQLWREAQRSEKTDTALHDRGFFRSKYDNALNEKLVHYHKSGTFCMEHV